MKRKEKKNHHRSLHKSPIVSKKAGVLRNSQRKKGKFTTNKLPREGKLEWFAV